MIGERLKMARKMRGLSQQDVADRVGISRMSISKYERAKMTPSSDVLVKLARALGIKVEYLLRPVEVTLSVPAFRKKSRLGKRKQYMMVERTREWLERYRDVERLFGALPRFVQPEIDRYIESVAGAERVAEELRRAWDLGFDAIDNLMEILEARAIKVGVVEGVDDFDALTMWVNEEQPVIVVKGDLPGDRQRFNLAHELGHLILEPIDTIDEEKAAYRFAGAFLVPERVVRQELGEYREWLHLHELHLLKHKYGLSMQAWIYRAKDLGIISEASAGRLFGQFRKRGWHREEPGDPITSEKPGRMKRLVLRALAEEVISRSRAAELLGESLDHLWEEEAKEHRGLPASVYR